MVPSHSNERQLAGLWVRVQQQQQLAICVHGDVTAGCGQSVAQGDTGEHTHAQEDTGEHTHVSLGLGELTEIKK